MSCNKFWNPASNDEILARKQFKAIAGKSIMHRNILTTFNQPAFNVTLVTTWIMEFFGITITHGTTKHYQKRVSFIVITYIFHYSSTTHFTLVLNRYLCVYVWIGRGLICCWSSCACQFNVRLHVQWTPVCEK